MIELKALIGLIVQLVPIILGVAVLTLVIANFILLHDLFKIVRKDNKEVEENRKRREERKKRKKAQ